MPTTLNLDALHCIVPFSFSTCASFEESLTSLFVLALALWAFGQLVSAVVPRLLALTVGRARRLAELSPKSVAALTHILDSHSHAFRKKAKAVLVDDAALFAVNTDTEWAGPVDDQRGLALKRGRAFVQRSGASVHDILKDPLQFIAAHETFALSDPAAIYNFSVHFNLFGGSVLKLGTAKHHAAHLEAIDRMETLGCFALTELQHGVISGMNLETTATYEPGSEQFTLHTPSAAAQKNWISFVAKHAELAVVFAQLLLPPPGGGEPVSEGVDTAPLPRSAHCACAASQPTRACLSQPARAERPRRPTARASRQVSEGVHAFLVPLRKRGKVVPGVRIEDQGHKPVT